MKRMKKDRSDRTPEHRELTAEELKRVNGGDDGGTGNTGGGGTGDPIRST